jgi:hypothetical protein
MYSSASSSVLKASTLKVLYSNTWYLAADFFSDTFFFVFFFCPLRGRGSGKGKAGGVTLARVFFFFFIRRFSYVWGKGIEVVVDFLYPDFHVVDVVTFCPSQVFIVLTKVAKAAYTHAQEHADLVYG